MRSAGTLIRYDGEVLGFATATRVRYTAALERRAEAEPLRARWLRRFIFAMGLYAIDVARASLAAPYDDARAEHFARTFLIDDEVFRGCADRADVQLAGRFGVPVAQIALKRLDLAAEPPPGGSPRSRAAATAMRRAQSRTT
jgi:hypothetical protein